MRVISQRLAQLDAVRRLGATWVFLRLKGAFDHRTGRTASASPVGRWDTDSRAQLSPLGLVDNERLTAWLQANSDPRRREDLASRARELSERTFDVFGSKVHVPDWHVDPVSGARYRSDSHWSATPEIAGCDLKCVWEPSRFGWAFDLARLHLLDPDSNAAELFWELFDDWCTSNPPNVGVNWKCGQESSIRLLAVTLASQAMPEAMTDQRRRLFRQFVEVTGDRVLAHLDYARSQRNNHLSSEAMGLTLAALLLPGATNAWRWMQGAEAAWSEVDADLIFADGGSSQYSLNYHRVFLHALCVAHLACKSAGQSIEDVDRAMLRAHRFMEAMCEPVSGSGPFFGHDDGACILPLSDVPHRDLRSTVALGAALAEGSIPAHGPWSEALAWFGLDQLPVAPQRPGGSTSVESFPDMGIHVATAGRTRVYLRAGPSRYRPAHADQLNLDIWHDGQNVVLDRGTYCYTADTTNQQRFIRSDHHNTVVFDDHDHMPRVGRFLWARWTDGQMHSSKVGADFVSLEATARLRTPALRVERNVEIWESKVVVVDRCHDAGTAWSTYWQLTNAHVDLLEHAPDEVVATRQERAPSYRQLVSDVVVVRRRPDTSGTVTSNFCLRNES